MRLGLSAVWAGVGCVAMAACGGDDKPSSDPYEGVYQSISQTENEDGCDVEGPGVTPIDPFFELNKFNFFGTTILGYFRCTDPQNCEEDADLFGSFHEKRDGNWVGVIKFASHGGSYCLMGETVRTLTGEPESEIVVSSVMSTTSDAGLTETQCIDSDLDVLIEEHRDDLECVSLDVLHATLSTSL